LAKILVVEDDALIAMELAERLVDLGHAALGPAHSITEAEAVIARERPDAALLDANLGGQSSVGLGVTLAGRGVPVAFCTGYDQVKGTPPELASAPVLTKPYSDAELKDTLAKLGAR
jgi:DNA-binding LytR/AlgR family response regulator